MDCGGWKKIQSIAGCGIGAVLGYSLNGPFGADACIFPENYFLSNMAEQVSPIATWQYSLRC